MLSGNYHASVIHNFEKCVTLSLWATVHWITSYNDIEIVMRVEQRCLHIMTQ